MFIHNLRTYLYFNWIMIVFKNICGKHKSEKRFTLYEEFLNLNS